MPMWLMHQEGWIWSQAPCLQHLGNTQIQVWTLPSHWHLYSQDISTGALAMDYYRQMCTSSSYLQQYCSHFSRIPDFQDP